MTLADELIAAVQCGGLNKWTTSQNNPTCQSAINRRKHKTTQGMDKVLNSIRGLMTAAEISKESGFCQDTTYKYLVRFMDEGKVIRERSQPFVYRRK